MKQPITTSRPRFRGPLSSHTLNRQLDDTYYDLFHLYKQINADKAELERVKDFFYAEVMALSEQFENLNRERYVVQARDMVTVYPNSAQDASDTSLRAFVDRNANVVVLPLKGSPVPKTYLYDLHSNIFVPPDTKVSVGEQSPELEGDPLDLVDPRKKFWSYHFSYDLGVAPPAKEISVQIELSPQALTDYRINVITFAAHPLYTMTIKNLNYIFNSGWRPVPGFSPVEKATAYRWCFPPIEAKGFTFTLWQPFSLIEGTQRIFVLGGRQFGVFYQEYERSGIILSPFVIPYGSKVAKVKHYFANAPCLSVPRAGGIYEQATPFFEFGLYKEENDGTLTYLNNWQNIAATKVWVRTVLKLDSNGVTPALKKVALELL